MVSNTTGVHDSLHLGSYCIHYYKSYKFETKHDSLITLFLASESNPINTYGAKWNIIGQGIMDQYKFPETISTTLTTLAFQQYKADQQKSLLKWGGDRLKA